MDWAVTYIPNWRSDLMTYPEDGHYSLSNYRCENVIRPFTVGYKNWVLCDTPNGYSG